MTYSTTDQIHPGRLILLMSVLLLSTSTWAGDALIEQWYLQPRLHANQDNGSFGKLNAQTLSIGKTLDQRIDLEINLLSDNPDYRQENQGILIDGRYYLKPRGNFNPYIAGGVSSVRNYNQLDTSYQDPVTNLGLGFEHTMKRSGARIQADLRYFIDDRQAENLSNNEPVHDWTLSFGLSIPLGSDLFK